MLLEKKQLLYKPFLVLDHASMLVSKLLCEQHSFLYHTDCKEACCTYQFSYFFPSKNGKSLCKSGNSLGYLISTSRKQPISPSSL